MSLESGGECTPPVRYALRVASGPRRHSAGENAEHHRHPSEAQLVAIGEGRGRTQLPTVEEGPILAPQILERGLPSGNTNARVPAGDACRLDSRGRLLPPGHDGFWLRP